MANQSQPADSRGLNWLDIDDFTPGIYSNANFLGAMAGNSIPIPAPLGAADPNETYNCWSMNNGGLGPGPGLLETYDLASYGLDAADFPLTYTAIRLAGIENTLLDSYDTFVINIEGLTSVDNKIYLYELSETLNSPTASSIAAVQTVAIGTYAEGIGGSPFMFMTRVAASDPTTTVGQPVMVIPLHSLGQFYIWPNPSSPTTALSGVFLPSTPGSTGGCGPCFGHQSRIVSLMTTPAIPFPEIPTLIFWNDPINYTDPPNSQTFPGVTSPTNEVFVAEQPYGYGAVGSVSAGELFLVKRWGGGVVIQGDLNNPTVTFLPGVKSTGPVYGRADAGSQGLYYCTQNEGVHVWNGGNSSQKVSQNIDDSSFFSFNFTNPSAASFLNFDYYIRRWGKWMIVANQNGPYVLDTDTGGWWLPFGQQSVNNLYWWIQSYNQQYIYGCPVFLPTTASSLVTTPLIYQYSREFPTSSYRWQSLPIRVTEDRLNDVREVVIRCSTTINTGPATCSVTPSIVQSNGTVIAGTAFTFDNNTSPNFIHMQRFVFPPSQSEDIRLRLDCSTTNDEAAPTIHAVSIGYKQRQHSGQATG